jgi:hypothetical protein
MLRALMPTTRLYRFGTPLAIYALCACVYVLVLDTRREIRSTDNHYVHLADSFLHGRLDLPGDPPGTNDWACFDRELRGPCPPGFSFSGEDAARYRWFVSFPPFPAVVIMPAVAALGVEMNDRIYFALVAGLGPMAVYLMLRRLRRSGSGRSERDDLLLTVLFAFGTVFFFAAVQGSVWFAAHMVAVPLIAFYLLASIDAERPATAGLLLGLAFMTRPTTLLLGSFFVLEALRASRKGVEEPASEDTSTARVVLDFLRGTSWRVALPKVARFVVPLLAVGCVAMAFNEARFGDPFEFGHNLLQVGWRGRIEKWGLFNYHFMAKNLAIFTSSLPWLSREAPYVKLSAHGLALWVTTPALLLVLFPKRVDARYVALAIAVLPVVVLNLMYQNSGWLQFGYRFALDYMPALFAMLALCGRRFRAGFVVLCLFAVAINVFGAVTFDRAQQFYDIEGTQTRIFQPD